MLLIEMSRTGVGVANAWGVAKSLERCWQVISGGLPNPSSAVFSAWLGPRKCVETLLGNLTRSKSAKVLEDIYHKRSRHSGTLVPDVLSWTLAEAVLVRQDFPWQSRFWAVRSLFLRRPNADLQYGERYEASFEFSTDRKILGPMRALFQSCMPFYLGHIAPTNTRSSYDNGCQFNFVTCIGLTDGEAVERAWASSGPLVFGKEMTAGSRRGCLHDSVVWRRMGAKL
ncbi:hypothetical protein B0H13DRAFT_1899472 [Mycena leptocephala]|nr:hypothetical protein B0H13DRAFT_1899472 [Mycena leptocephala]